MKNDIVYVLKEGVDSDELRYSLRSVCKNFNFNEIWFYGGCPKDIQPDHWVQFSQVGLNKWHRTRSMYQAIFENNDITPDFFLFNDDFFIMRHYRQDLAISNGTLDMQAFRIQCANNGFSRYTERLKHTATALRKRGFDTISYECHVPMLINREKALKLLTDFKKDTAFRSTYGNYYSIGGRLIDDYKIVRLDQEPDREKEIISTTEESFAKGIVGDYIKKKFPNKCRYEL